MGKPFIFEIPNLGGGLNEAAADSISDSEMSLLENFYVSDRGALQQAPGRTELSSAYSARINSITRYNPGFTTDEYTIVGANGSVARLNAGALVAFEPADGRVYASVDNRWWFRQYNDELFACQKANGGLKRIYGDSIMEAGIPAPTTPCVISDGGAGQKTAGQYQVCYSFYNTLTGAESNLSPPSNTLTLTLNHRIRVDSIGVSSSRQVNGRRIYVTLPDDLGGFYLVGELADNVTTGPYYENMLPPEEYGAVFEYTNGPPPTQAHALEIANERLFLTDGKGVYWSEAGKMQSFKSSSYYPISRDDGYEVIGLKWWEDHGLIMAKQNLVMILTGYTPSDWTPRLLTGEHGTPAGQSFAVGDGVLFWYTGVNFVRSGGSSAEIIPSSDRIRQTMDSIPEDEKSDVQADSIPSKGWVVWTVPTDSGRKLIVYDYKKDAWTTFTSAPDTIKRFVKDDQSEVLLATWDSDDKLYEYLTGQSGMNTAKLRTKAFGYDQQGRSRIVRRVGVLTPKTAGTIDLKVINDINGSVVLSRNVSVNRYGWKRIALPTSSSPGQLHQIQLEYSGTTPLRVDQLQIEGVDLGRRGAVL